MDVARPISSRAAAVVLPPSLFVPLRNAGQGSRSAHRHTGNRPQHSFLTEATPFPRHSRSSRTPSVGLSQGRDGVPGAPVTTRKVIAAYNFMLRQPSIPSRPAGLHRPRRPAGHGGRFTATHVAGHRRRQPPHELRAGLGHLLLSARLPRPARAYKASITRPRPQLRTGTSHPRSAAGSAAVLDAWTSPILSLGGNGEDSTSAGLAGRAGIHPCVAVALIAAATAARTASGRSRPPSPRPSRWRPRLMTRRRSLTGSSLHPERQLVAINTWALQPPPAAHAGAWEPTTYGGLRPLPVARFTPPRTSYRSHAPRG